jgi:hypothetical protein
MGQYIGQSAPMVLEKMKDALGGILFIDGNDYHILYIIIVY